jgi:hypothetical protein
MAMRMIGAAMLALVAADANAAAFVVKNCSGAPITVTSYNSNDELLALPFSIPIVIAHGTEGLMRCNTVSCKVKVEYSGGAPANWASFYYSYDSCARYADVAELQTYSNCVC